MSKSPYGLWSHKAIFIHIADLVGCISIFTLTTQNLTSSEFNRPAEHTETTETKGFGSFYLLRFASLRNGLDIGSFISH